MAFKVITQKVAKKQLLKQIETKVNGKITINDERVVERVLDGVGDVFISNEDKMGDFLQFLGTINLSVLFSNEEHAIDSENITLEFNEKTNILGSGESVCIVPEITSVKAQKESDKVINVIVCVKSKVYGIGGDEISFVSGEEDGFYTKTKEVRCDNLAATSASSFSVVDEITLSDTVSKILYAKANTFASKVVPHDNYLVVEGSSYVEVAYLSDGQFKKQTKTIDFSEEVACLNLTSDMLAFVDLYTKNILASLDVKEDGAKPIINLDLAISYAAWGYSKNNYSVITDAFSENSEANIILTAFNTNIACEGKLLSDRQTIVADMMDKKRMDEIINVSVASEAVEQVVFENNKLVVRGNLSVDIIFKNYDSEDVLLAQTNSPFELKFVVDEISSRDIIDASVLSKINSYKNKAGKDISFAVDFDVLVSSCLNESEIVASKIETVGLIPTSEHSVIVYKPEKDESVFDIAKNLKISPDVLLAQNPSLEDGTIIQKVVIYKKVN